MAQTIDYFIPPAINQATVLAHDLTPLPANACETFVRAYVPDGGLVWDPFCRTDIVGRVAAQQGKRALLSDFNPLVAFTVQATLEQALPRQIDRALAALGAAPIGHATLDAHLNSLYATVCPACGAPAIGTRYSWSLETNRLLSKHVVCERCQLDRDDPAAEHDSITLSKIEERGRAYWALLEHMGATEGPLQSLGQRLLDLYTARSLYALSVIQSKLDLIILERGVREILMLALLDVMERSVKRYVDERGQGQRAGVTRPPAAPHTAMFSEINCWRAFAEACAAQRARLERRPDIVLRSGTAPIQVQRAAARRVASNLAEGSVDLILAMPPTLDWSDTLHLTYLWTAWLLGKDEARLFSADYLLHPTRANDWPWTYIAMEKSFRAMAGALSSSGKMILCHSLTGLGYLNVLALAAAAAGLCLENVAYQPYDSEGVQRPPALGALAGYCYLRFGWRPRGEQSPGDVMVMARSEAAAAARAVAAARAEPAAYVWLHLAMAQRLSQSGLLARLTGDLGDESTPWDRLRQIQTGAPQDPAAGLEFLPALHDATVVEPAADEAQPLAKRRGWWRLAQPDSAVLPVCDRAEWATYTVLSTTPTVTLPSIERVIYALFPGLLTPLPGLIEATVRSYAAPASSGQWRLRPEETLVQRSRDHAAMIMHLVELGHRLGARVWVNAAELRDRQNGAALSAALAAGERYASIEEIAPAAVELGAALDVAWYGGPTLYLFQVEWTAMLSEAVALLEGAPGDAKRYILVPGERADLIRHKMGQAPGWRGQRPGAEWAFIRFDALHELGRAESPAFGDLDQISGLDRRAVDEGVQLTLL